MNKPVGLEGLKMQMEELARKGDAFRKGGAKVPHVVMNLARENGQSVAADYITSVLYDNRLRRFRGMDCLLEYRLDGSMKQLKRVFEDISDNAVYTNEYEGVAAIDISALAECANEIQTDYFVEQIEETAKSATVIIFYDESLGGRIRSVKERVLRALGNYIEVSTEPYSQREYSEIIVRNIRERGIEIESGEESEKILSSIVEENHVTNAGEAASLADDLLFCADYSDFRPRITAKSLSEYADKWKSADKRSGYEK